MTGSRRIAPGILFFSEIDGEGDKLQIPVIAWELTGVLLCMQPSLQDRHRDRRVGDSSGIWPSSM